MTFNLILVKLGTYCFVVVNIFILKFSISVLKNGVGIKISRGANGKNKTEKQHHFASM